MSYSRERTFRLVGLLAFIWVHGVHESVPSLTMAGLVVWALLGRLHALQALSLGVLVTFLNPDLFPKAPGGEMMKWLILVAASARLHYDAVKAYRRPSPSVALLGLFAAVTTGLAWTSSQEPALSLMKLGSFYLGASSILLAFQHPNDLSQTWSGWLLSLFSAVLISSLPLLASPIGYYAGIASQFRGILANAQAYGWFLAPLLCLAAGRWISDGARDLLGGLSVVAGGATILASGSRTAAFALVLGLMVTMAIAVASRRDWLHALGGVLRSTHGLVFLCTGLIFALFAAERIAVILIGFATDQGADHDSTTGLYDTIAVSRGVLIDRSWSNFTREPLTGIGFGIASDPMYRVVLNDPLFGLPVSASVEKGFMPTAVLEEVGIIGTTSLLLFLASLAVPIVRHAPFHQAWLFWTCLFLNFGDMAFFSIGGLGAHLWLLIGFASHRASRR